MRHLLALLLCVFVLTPAWAQEDGHTRLAEYTRLTQEIQSLAKKGHWAGVERAYRAMLDTGIPPTADEYVAGAQAARQLGDVTEARQRIVLALEVLNVHELRDWLSEIDTSYGPVALYGDPGKVSLETDAIPFDPLKKAAVEHAMAEVDATGSYEGLLPAGNYRFGSLSIDVRPGVSTERIDVRSDKYMRKLERIERRELKKNGGDASGDSTASGDPFYD